MVRIVVEIIDGNDGDLIGYGVAVVNNGTWTLEPTVYPVRSEAMTAADREETPAWSGLRPLQQVDAVVRAWRERHLDEWRGYGHAHSAPEYANTVAGHRLGVRTSLSFPNELGHGPVSNTQARHLLRQQVDAILAELSEGI